MRRIFISGVFALILTLPFSCYKDLGNYEYREINEIVITVGEYSYITPKAGKTDVVHIEPEIVQTMSEGTDHLVYEWKRQTGAVTWEKVGDGPSYDLIVTSEDVGKINFRFSATDTALGITTYAEISVNPIFAFSQCWFLLQDIDGTAVLGSVDGEGAGRVMSSDIYMKETGGTLSGKPKHLGIHPYMRTTSMREDPLNPNYEILLGVFTDAVPYILKGATLEEHRMNYDRILYGKRIEADGTAPEKFAGARGNFAAVDNGRLWYACNDELALMFPVSLSDELGGGFGYRAEDVLVTYDHGSSMLVYDGLGKRFLHYVNTVQGDGYNVRKQIVDGAGTADDLYRQDTYHLRDRLVEIGENVKLNRFNPSSLPGGFVLDGMFLSSGDGYKNALAVGHVGNEFKVYEFSMAALEGVTAEVPYCSNAWSVPAVGTLPSGKMSVTSSTFFDRMFFYADGRSVYCVDMTMAVPEVKKVWECDDASSVITALKFKSDDADVAYTDVAGSEDFQYKGITRHLGVIVQDQQGDCRLVEMHLTAAGEIEHDSDTDGLVIYEFDGGFRNVVDLVFSFRDLL